MKIHLPSHLSPKTMERPQLWSAYLLHRISGEKVDNFYTDSIIVATFLKVTYSTRPMRQIET